MKIYLKYLWSLLRHKWYVFIECYKVGLYLHGITHDLSKFLPSEFKAYAHYFCGERDEAVIKAFKTAWCHHKNRNKHHWDHWVLSNGEAVPMPEKYVRQMVADWRAMSRTHGGSPTAFLDRNKGKIKLHPETTKKLISLFSEQDHVTVSIQTEESNRLQP